MNTNKGKDRGKRRDFVILDPGTSTEGVAHEGLVYSAADVFRQSSKGGKGVTWPPYETQVSTRAHDHLYCMSTAVGRTRKHIMRRPLAHAGGGTRLGAIAPRSPSSTGLTHPHAVVELHIHERSRLSTLSYL